jgi:hypothetical protein
VPSAARHARATSGTRFFDRIGNNMQQFGDTFTPDRRDNAELGEVSSNNRRLPTADSRGAKSWSELILWYGPLQRAQIIRRIAEFLEY